MSTTEEPIYQVESLIAEDIDAYLEKHQHKTMLRFITCGSVDDGKSTLIGRLLYDSKAVMEDQLAAVEKTSAERGNDYTDLALVTDGLRAEREQGITIDVAYRYFATAKRKFIIADTPGHIQYTRNMVTGALTMGATGLMTGNPTLMATGAAPIVAGAIGGRVLHSSPVQNFLRARALGMPQGVAARSALYGAYGGGLLSVTTGDGSIVLARR